MVWASGNLGVCHRLPGKESGVGVACASWNPSPHIAMQSGGARPSPPQSSFLTFLQGRNAGNLDLSKL